jgi:hypothetical protein
MTTMSRLFWDLPWQRSQPVAQQFSLAVLASGAFVIPTGGRNLLVAGTMALQATADSSTANAVSE